MSQQLVVNIQKVSQVLRDKIPSSDKQVVQRFSRKIKKVFS